jgi:nucleoid-associated protein YgaU
VISHDSALANFSSTVTPAEPPPAPPPPDDPQSVASPEGRGRPGIDPKGVLRYKTRVGLAALLSILILVAALAAHRGLRGGHGPTSRDDRDVPAPLAPLPRNSASLTAQIPGPDSPPPPAPPPAVKGGSEGMELPPRPADDADRHSIHDQVAQNAGPERPPLPLPQLSDAGDSSPESESPVPPAPASADSSATPGEVIPPQDPDSAPRAPQLQGGAAAGAPDAEAAPSLVMLAAMDASKAKPEPTGTAPSQPGAVALPPPVGAAPQQESLPPPPSQAPDLGPMPATGEPALPLPVESPPSNPPAVPADKPEGTAAAPPPPSPAQSEPSPSAPPVAEGEGTAKDDDASRSLEAGGAPKTTPETGPSVTGSPPATRTPAVGMADELPTFTPLPTSDEPSALPSAAVLAGWTAIPNAGKMRMTRSDTDNGDASTEERRPPHPQDEDRLVPVPHVVQRGENFWTISRLYYNTGRFYKALWAANRATVPVIDRLYVGTTIQIPPPEALDRSLVERPQPSSPGRSTHPLAARDRQTRRTGRESDVTLVLPVGSPEAEAGSLVAAEPDPKAATWPEAHRPVHTVRASETLRTIARARLGDAHRADEILRLNRDVIEDPHRLVPGMSLRLPANASSERVVR